MENEKQFEVENVKNLAKSTLLPYEPPRIVTRTDDELLEVMGPAHGYSPGPIGP